MILFYIVLFLTIFAVSQYSSRRLLSNVPQFAFRESIENAIISAIVTLLAYLLINFVF